MSFRLVASQQVGSAAKSSQARVHTEQACNALLQLSGTATQTGLYAASLEGHIPYTAIASTPALGLSPDMKKGHFSLRDLYLWYKVKGLAHRTEEGVELAATALPPKNPPQCLFEVTVKCKRINEILEPLTQWVPAAHRGGRN